MSPKAMKIVGITLLVVIGLIIGIVIYQKVVKDVDERKYVDDLPNNGNGIPTEGVSENGKPVSWNPLPITEELHEVLYGFSMIDIGNSSKKTAVYAKLMALTNDQLVAVYNAYNARYMEEDGDGTLRDVIEDEWFEDSQGNAKKVLDRMVALDLRKAEKKDKSWW